jgi:hypothetical protein
MGRYSESSNLYFRVSYFPNFTYFSEQCYILNDFMFPQKFTLLPNFHFNFWVSAMKIYLILCPQNSISQNWKTIEVCAGKAATSLHIKILNLKRESSDNFRHKYIFILAVMLVERKKTQMTAAGQLQYLHFSITSAFFTLQLFVSVILYFSQFYVYFWWVVQNIFLFQVIL